MRIALVALLVVMVGCAGTDELGKIGNTTFYSVHGDHLWGPNFTAMVVEKGGEVGVVKVGFGPGAGHAIVGGFTKVAADVGASAVQWHGYKPNTYRGDSVSVSGTSSSASTQEQTQSKPEKPKDCKPETPETPEKPECDDDGGDDGEDDEEDDEEDNEDEDEDEDEDD